MESKAVNSVDDLVEIIQQSSVGKSRYIISISGAPGSGKSTLSTALKNKLDNSAIVQMDGFHLDDAILKDRNLIDRKGAPETFDVGGFKSILSRIADQDEEAVYVPYFDRSKNLSIGSAVEIPKAVQYIIVEGNYLLLNASPWNELKPLFNLNVFADVDKGTLESRLTKRWLDLGFSRAEAQSKVRLNDMANAELIIANRLTCDIVM